MSIKCCDEGAQAWFWGYLYYFTQYFWLCSRSSPHPYPPDFMFSLSQKNWTTTKPPENFFKNINIRKHKKSTKQGIRWPATPGRHGVCAEVWLVHTGTRHWRKLAFPFPSLSLQIASWLEFGLDLYWSCMCCCNRSWASVLLCLEDVCFHGAIHHLRLLQPSHFLFCLDSWALRGGVWWRHSIWDRVLESLSPHTLSGCGSLLITIYCKKM